MSDSFDAASRLKPSTPDPACSSVLPTMPGMSRARPALSRDDAAPIQCEGVEGTPRSMSRRARTVLSVLLILHLVAITSAPLAMEPSSLLGQKLFGVFRPYLDLFYLNHGYHFFAPEPGPGHLIRYEIEMSDGHVMDGVFPDPDKQRPRLLYHRHFMLTEFANRLAVDPGQQEAMDELARSFAEHLIHQNNGERATLYLQRHYIPTPEQVASGVPLNSPELYAERSLGTYSRRSTTQPHRGPAIDSEPDAPLDGSEPPLPELAALQPQQDGTRTGLTNQSTNASTDPDRRNDPARLSFATEADREISPQNSEYDSEAIIGGREVIR